MEIDVADHIGAVNRVVREVDRDGRPARVVAASRTYDTTVEDLWDALTDPERIPRWFLPVTGELRPGGRYQLEGNAGGEITRCEPPGRLEVTWEFGGDVSWLAVTLDPRPDGGTELQLEHTAHVDDDRWAQYGPGAVGVGWDLALLGLAEHLRTGAALDPEQWATWSMSEEGRTVARRSSEGWRDASITAGTESEAAATAAARTTAFYTGEDEPTGEPATD